MKSPLFATLALMAACPLSAAEPVMPPDPLMQRLVPVPFTAADLIVRSITEAPGLNLWRLAGELDAMSTEQVRTVAFNCWRPYRRYEARALYAASMALSLWAERDLADATGTVMFIGSWEDMDDSIGDYDIDLESMAGWLWAQLAKRDWKKASALLGRVSGEESSGHFASSAAAFGNFTLKQAAQFVAAFSSKKMGQDSLQEVVQQLVRNLVAAHGLPAVQTWAKSLQAAPARGMALQFLTQFEHRSPAPPPALRTFSGDPLGKLRALDLYDGPWIMPFPLYRAVKDLPPAEALRLANEAAAHPLTQEGSWLHWMLFMRAAEGDALAAAHHACGPPLAGESQPLTEVFALRKDVSSALEEIGRMTDKTLREVALTGLSHHVDLTNPEQWLTTVAGLKANAVCAEPLFARLGAAGRGREALELASKLEDGFAGNQLTRAALGTWILADVRGFFRALREAGQSADPVQEERFRMMESAVNSLDGFGASELLLDDGAIPAKYLYWSGHEWTFPAFEEREFTFRFYERHADDPDYTNPINHFAEVAVRFEPERAVALIRRTHAAQLAAIPRGPSTIITDVSLSMGTTLRRLVQFWPEKALAITAPSTDKEWAGLCAEMLNQHPQRLAMLTQKAPETVRQSLAKLLTETDSTGREFSLSVEKRKVIAEALRSAK